MKITLSALTLILGLGLMAQKGERSERREQIELKKKAYCNEQAGLSEEEATAYWALQDELHEEKKALRKEAKALRDMDLDAASDAEVEKAIRLGLENKVKAQELDLAYLDRFLEVLSAKKLAKVKRAERSFKREVLRDLKDGPHGERVPMGRPPKR